MKITLRRLHLQSTFAGMALLFLVGDGFCDTSSCEGPGCPDHDTTKLSDNQRLSPGQTLVLIDLTCTTGSNCQHATVSATWSLPTGSTVTGKVALEVHGSCPDYQGGFVGDPASMSVDAVATSIADFEAVNNKSPCGVSVKETYTATLSNTSTVDLVNPVITLTCPTFGGSLPSGLAPSRTVRDR